MSRPDRNRIGIIGAGIVGVQVARAAQRSGFAVTLIDRGEPGHGTSYGNAGFIATDEIFPLARGRVLRSLPRMLLDRKGPLSIRWREAPRLAPWFLRYALACSTSRAKRSVAALAAIQQEAGAAWRRVAANEGLGSLLRTTGAWKLFETDSGLHATAAEREEQRRYGINWEYVDAPELRERLPEIGPTIRHGLYYADGMSVTSPLDVTAALLARVSAAGGTVVRALVRGLSLDAGRVNQVTTDAGVHEFEHVVIAAGHRAGLLLEPLGLRIPIVAERGYHVEMSHAELGFDCPVGLYERGFYMTPMRSGLRLAGTSEFSSAAHDDPPDWTRAEILKRHVDEIMPGVATAQTGRWMGHRPTLSDFLPALGPIPGTTNAYAAFGHHHLGLTLSAVTAEMVVAAIMGTPGPVDPQPYWLSRFQ